MNRLLELAKRGRDMGKMEHEAAKKWKPSDEVVALVDEMNLHLLISRAAKVGQDSIIVQRLPPEVCKLLEFEIIDAGIYGDLLRYLQESFKPDPTFTVEVDSDKEGGFIRLSWS